MRLLIRNFSVVLAITASLVMTGCGSNKKNAEAVEAGSAIDNRGLSVDINSDSDSQTAGPISSVYFAFNSSNLTGEARQILESNVQFLKDNPSIEVQVEGHCDERGGIQYNLALGERRAAAVRDYMIALGVDGSKVSTISFGKERPVAFGHSEDAWSKNRRGNFVVTAK